MVLISLLLFYPISVCKYRVEDVEVSAQRVLVDRGSSENENAKSLKLTLCCLCFIAICVVQGGGMYVVRSPTVTLTSCTFTTNIAVRTVEL